MAPRPNWKGYLKLSLVSCSVALYSATTTSERIRFNILNKKTGNRVRNLVIDSETEEPVEQEDRVKGYQFEKGQYIQVEDDELDEVALESTHTIDIDSFVPREEVDEIYLDESYYIVPTDKVAYEAFAVIRDAMAKEDLVGLARVVLSTQAPNKRSPAPVLVHGPAVARQASAAPATATHEPTSVGSGSGGVVIAGSPSSAARHPGPSTRPRTGTAQVIQTGSSHALHRATAALPG